MFMYSPARWGQSFMAFFLDLFILDWICFPLVFVVSPQDNPKLFMLVRLWIMITYFAAMESSPWKATLGKLLLGIRISRTDGETPLFHQTLQRTCLGICFFGVGFLRAIWNPHSLAWHDEYTQTCVMEEWWD